MATVLEPLRASQPAAVRESPRIAAEDFAASRLHAFDAVRAVAALLVVMLHAAIAYTLHPMPGLVWPTRDAAPSPLVDGIFWYIEGFIMPLFFLIAGFFAAGLYETLGPNRFLKHRARRLLLPLLFGMIVILPMDLYVWVLGWVCDGLVPLKKMRSLKFDGDIDRHLWGLSHLWFLQYLFLYCVLYRLGQGAVSRIAVTRFGALCRKCVSALRCDELLLSPWKPVVFAIPGAAVLWFAPEVVTGFQHGFVPFPAKFLYTIPFFLVGAWMHRYRDRLELLIPCSDYYVALSAAVFVGMLTLIHDQLTAELAGVQRLLLVGSISLFAWLTVLGLVGLFLAWFRRPNAVLRYAAEASFWVYLLHHPVVGLVQIDFARTPLSADMKFIAVTGIAFAFSLLTYHAFVRSTWIGPLLNGRRHFRTGRTHAETQPQPLSVPQEQLGRAA